MNSLTILRYNNDEEKFEEVKISFTKKIFLFLLFSRSHMMLIYNGQLHVNSLMMIPFSPPKMVEI
jgi:hypothetical protein